MKQFIKYLLFLIIGIIFYILLNNREKFSIGAPYVERSFNIVSGGDDGIYTYITLNGLVNIQNPLTISFSNLIDYFKVSNVLPIIYLGDFKIEPDGYSLLLQTKHFFLVGGYLVYTDKITQDGMELYKPENFGTNKLPIKLFSNIEDESNRYNITGIVDTNAFTRESFKFTVTGVNGVSINIYNSDKINAKRCKKMIGHYFLLLNGRQAVCSAVALPDVMGPYRRYLPNFPPLVLNNFISVVPPNAFVVPNNEFASNTACDGFFEIYDIDLNSVNRARGPNTDDDKIGLLQYTTRDNNRIGFTNVEELATGGFASIYTCSNMPMNLVQSSNNLGDKAYAVATKVYNDPNDSEIDFIRIVYGSNKVGIGWIFRKSYSDASDSSDSGQIDTIHEEEIPEDSYESFYNPYYTEKYILNSLVGLLNDIIYGNDANGDFQITPYFFNNNEFKTTIDNSDITINVEIDGEDREFTFNYHEYPNEVFPVDVTNCNLVNAHVIEPSHDITVPIVVMEYMDNNLKTLIETFLVSVNGIKLLSNVYILLCLEISKRILLSLVNLLANNLIYIDLKLQNVLYRCYKDSNIKVVLGDLGSIQSIYILIYGKGYGQTYQMPEMILYESEDPTALLEYPTKYKILANESDASMRLVNEYFCSWIICLMFLELFGIDLVHRYPILFFKRDFIRAGGGQVQNILQNINNGGLLENYYSSGEFITALTNVNQYFDNLINHLIFIRGMPPPPFTEDDIKRIFTLLKVKSIIKGCLKTLPRLLIGEINTLLNLELTTDDLSIMISSPLGQKLTICTTMLNDKITASTLNDDMKAFLVS
jgi:hypothetical protein